MKAKMTVYKGGGKAPVASMGKKVVKYQMGGKPPVKSYANGGVGPKGKAAAKPIAKTRQQEIEESKMVGARRAQDLKIADRIKKDVRSEVGPSMENRRPSGNKGNVTLSSAKSQKITEDSQVNYGRFKEGKFSRAELVEQFSGQKQQPIYRKGQTLGYAPEREISSGRGFTIGKDNLSSAKGGPVKSSPGSGAKPAGTLRPETIRAIELGFTPEANLRRAKMEDASMAANPRDAEVLRERAALRRAAAASAQKKK